MWTMDELLSRLAREAAIKKDCDQRRAIHLYARELWEYYTKLGLAVVSFMVFLAVMSGNLVLMGIAGVLAVAAVWYAYQTHAEVARYQQDTAVMEASIELEVWDGRSRPEIIIDRDSMGSQRATIRHADGEVWYIS